MSAGGPYNPLDKINLAKSIEIELLFRPLGPLADADGARGAGVYVIYYDGPFPAYRPITRALNDGDLVRPIYVGKAIPQGGAQGWTFQGRQSRSRVGRSPR